MVQCMASSLNVPHAACTKSMSSGFKLSLPCSEIATRRWCFQTMNIFKTQIAGPSLTATKDCERSEAPAHCVLCT